MVNLQKCIHLDDFKVGLMLGPRSRYPSPSGDVEAVQDACAPYVYSDMSFSYHAGALNRLMQRCLELYELGTIVMVLIRVRSLSLSMETA